MNEPFLAIYVKDDNLVITKKLPTEATPREILEVPIAELVADEFDVAASKLGETMLGILALWHKERLQGWGQMPTGGTALPDEESDFDIAMQLISQSVQSKTGVHIQSIELLLRQQAIKAESAQKFLDESWPPIRDRLQSYS